MKLIRFVFRVGGIALAIIGAACLLSGNAEKTLRWLGSFFCPALDESRDYADV